MRIPALILFILLFFAQPYQIQAQRKIEILNTDSLVFEKLRGADLRRLYGNVQFRHNDVLMFCDSAYFFAKNNMFNAYSNVHIKQSSTFNIYADSLIYEGKRGLAQLRGDVKLIDDETILTTNFLDYDLNQDFGYYFGGGKIVDAENILISESGRYMEVSKEFFFKDSVKLTNPDYVIDTDTLKYNSTTDVAFFFGPSYIVSDENLIYTENGWYNTITDIAQFKENAYLNNNDQFIYGDSLHYDRNIGVGQAWGNVLIKDTLEKIFLHGEYSYYKQEPEFCFVKDSLLMVKAFENPDSLFLHADSLTIETIIPDTAAADTSRYRIMKAFHKVRFFKSDIQGKCDSIVYNFRDSLIYLYTKPVIWSGENQITGEQIKIHLLDNGVDRVYIDNDAYLVQQDDSIRFNQVKGRSMIGYIKGQDLYRLDVSRNGETIYFMRDDIELIGVNKASCEEISIHFVDSDINTIVFKKQPVGTLFPPNQLTIENTRLLNFIWLSGIRPINKFDIFNWKD